LPLVESGQGRRLSLSPALAARIQKVLVVEDDGALRGAVARLTRGWGAETHEASSIRGAVSLLARHQLDLVITDVRLPDGSADTIVAAAAKLHPRPVIVGMSGLASAEESFELARLGADVYIAKPFSLQQLKETVEAVLDGAPDLAPFISRAVGRESLPDVTRSVRKVMVEEAIARAEGSRSGAARLLNVTRQAVQQALQSFDDGRPSDRAARGGKRNGGNGGSGPRTGPDVH
jgi:DNA-binding NtrC family response regulator